jgi:hypothetical protein
VVVLTAAAAGACDGSFQADGVVQITPNPPAWVGAPPFEASATILQANGDPIPDTFAVSAEITWATPPGQGPVRRTVTAFKTDDGMHRITGIDARSAQVATVVWEVAGSDGQGLAESEPVEVQVDCPSGPEPYLQSMQTTVTDILSGLETIDEDGLASVGYRLNNHGWAQLPGGGVSFIPSNLGDALDVNKPPLLLFTAPDDADITDNNADSDLVLAGWGYASLKVNDERPTLGCVPFHLWSVHEAGWHTPDDGGMVLDDGTAASTEAAAQRGGSPLTYHPQLWDIHFWLEPGSDVPSSSILNMDDDGGLIPSDGGSIAPDGMFFFTPFPMPEGAS